MTARSRWLAAVPAFALLGVVVLYPLGLVLGTSLRDGGGWAGLSQYAELLADPDILAAAAASVRLCVSVSLGCLVLGVPLAWLTVRSDLAGKALVRGGVAVVFLIPSFITVIAWTFLLAPNSGVLNDALVRLFGLAAPPFNVFSFGGLIFVETVHLFPIVFFAVSAALDNVDVNQEQAARVAGAGRTRTMLTVTLPLVLPAIASSVLLCLLDSLSSFGAPAAIGTMANFSVLSTKIFQLLTFPPRLGVAAALAVPVALVALVLVWLQGRLVKAGRFRTLTGKNTARELVRLGRLRLPLSALVLVGVAAISLLPMLGLVALSLLPSLGSPLDVGSFVLSHYAAVFDPSFTVLAAVRNSLFLAVGAASVCLACGAALGWLVERVRFPGHQLATALVGVAYGVPSVILGVGVLLGYIGALYGTLAIIGIAYAARFLPIAFVYVRSLMAQLSPELEEAARASGAGWMRATASITVPLLRPGAAAAWLLIFALCLREQPMSAVLAQGDTAVVSTAVLQFIENGSVEVAAALSVLVVLASLLCLLAVRLLTGRLAQPDHTHADGDAHHAH